MHNCVAIIVAAGRGHRMGSSDNGPKQYRKLGSQAVLNRTISRFVNHHEVDLVLPVIHADDLDLFNNSVLPHAKLMDPVAGGATRQKSGFCGLRALETLEPNTVLIHDGVRPFTEVGTISDVINSIEPGICALPAHPISDTLKHVDEQGFIDGTVSRASLFGAQTPQGFVYKEILAAHRLADGDEDTEYTDDAQIAEAAGLKVRIVPSPATNTKITTQEDLEAANMRYQTADTRTGIGYDVHRLVAGNIVTLCGVEIPHTHSLDGHSDADVGLHALTDALLGTIADGDIGSHFPPSDKEWKNASSDRFLKHAVNLVRENDGTITHLDITLICEAPKIGPHRDEMRSTVSEITGVNFSRVSVKATTNERIGFIGRQEGIAAMATVTVSFGTMDMEELNGN
ncbi:MAG: bifunctional 2-C-methyl-D-erythritol 4-phosphate cytidylyltransferase/2-C-methyl-D-erythritol 2,4-cyclodiphosphate synthase [Pseudomonadota bacterium]